MENPKPDESRRPTNSKGPIRSINPNLLLVVVAVFLLSLFLLTNQQQGMSAIDYSFFLEQIAKKNIAKVQLRETSAVGLFNQAPLKPPEINIANGERTKPKADEKLQQQFVVELSLSSDSRAQLEEKLLASGAVVDYAAPSDSARWTMLFLAVALPLGFFVLLFILFRRAQNQIMGGGFLSGFSKSPAKRYEPNKRPVTFKDVAGLEGVKADLLEIVEFLKDPTKFQRLGGRVPKGVLLNGPPGTGKTLLARAIAGEAGVPFYSVSGSEFIQMFVGVGASRVRDLFSTAKENSPAIIFVDEIDAVGRQRGAGLGGGHDEREQTLNQILSEMDGFEVNETVIVVAATNRPDVLDPAPAPGRFDRHVTVDRPTLRGREDILKVHVRDVPLADDVNLRRVAEGTTGLTGADLRNIVNEAALWATRQDHDKVYASDFDYAIDKTLLGAKREEIIQGKEKEKTAYHEAGHALVAWLSKNVERVHKVTVIPRGRALGVTQMVPDEDRFNINQDELSERLSYFLGGRAAEHLVYSQYSAGAENDLERATNIARRMVTQWGMSARLGPVSYKVSDEDPFLGREIHQQRHFSESTMRIIDEEVAKILHECSERAEKLLRENRSKLDRIVEALLEKEVLNEREIVELIGPAARDSAESNGKADKHAFGKKTDSSPHAPREEPSSRGA